MLDLHRSVRWKHITSTGCVRRQLLAHVNQKDWKRRRPNWKNEPLQFVVNLLRGFEKSLACCFSANRGWLNTQKEWHWSFDLTIDNNATSLFPTINSLNKTLILFGCLKHRRFWLSFSYTLLPELVSHCWFKTGPSSTCTAVCCTHIVAGAVEIVPAVHGDVNGMHLRPAVRRAGFGEVAWRWRWRRHREVTATQTAKLPLYLLSNFVWNCSNTPCAAVRRTVTLSVTSCTEFLGHRRKKKKKTRPNLKPPGESLPLMWAITDSCIIRACRAARITRTTSAVSSISFWLYGVVFLFNISSIDLNIVLHLDLWPLCWWCNVLHISVFVSIIIIYHRNCVHPWNVLYIYFLLLCCRFFFCLFCRSLKASVVTSTVCN